MSMGGLLANMVGGGVVGAAQGAAEQSKLNAKKEMEDLQNQRSIALEAMRASNNRANSQMEIDARSDLAKNENETRLAAARIQAGKASPAKVWEPITQKDLEGNVTVVGKFNSATSEHEMFNGGGGAAVNSDEALFKAEEYADKVISEKSGLLSTDATDFAQFGGSRERARQYYIQEYLGQKSSANPVDVLKSRFGER